MKIPADQDLPKDRHFGLLFAVVFLVLAAYSHLRAGPALLVTAMAAAATAFLICSLAAPQVLRPLNRLWFELGAMLARIVNPIVLGVLFFAVMTPVAIVTRLMGRDVLKLKKQDVDSHWVRRDPPGPAPESYRDQF